MSLALGLFSMITGPCSHPDGVARAAEAAGFGHTDAALRRAVEQGNGWYGFALEDGTRPCLDGLRAAAGRCERPAGLGPLEISVTPRPTRGGEAMDRASADRFATLGSTASS